LPRNFVAWLPTAFLVAAMLVFSACLEDPGSTGLGVIPDNDRLQSQFNDTTTVWMESVQVDSVNSYRAARQLVGNYVDPDFGRITATTYTQVLSSSGLKFSDSASNLLFDSLVLRLQVDGAYGRLETPQTLHIYELTDTFPSADKISSRTSVAYNSSKDLADNYQLNFATGGFRTLSIRLDDELGQRILFADEDTLEDRDLFSQFFKGFRIGTDPVNFFTRDPGAIYSINAAGEESQLRLFYQKRDSAHLPFEPRLEVFTILGVTPRFTHIERTDLSDDKLLAMSLPNPDTARQYEFIQAGALIKTRVNFPYLAEEPIAIQRAELILKVDPSWLGSNNRFTPPSNLNVVLADENGLERELDDGSFSLVTSPAVYNENDQTYSLIITNYLQEIISGQRANNGFILWPTNPQTTVNRVVLGGSEHSFLNPVLKMTYSTLPK
jgi:hypothetical protein